jgi:anti-sigma factor RsiW
MTRGTEQDLMSLLHGELPANEARVLQARLQNEPELAAAYRRLEQAWQGLSLPPASPVPPGFAGRVMAHVRSQSAPGGLPWSAAPGWVRATAAAALVAGAALGIGVGRSWPAPQTNVTAVTTSASLSTAAEEDYSLAGSYWSLVEDAAAGKETEARP